LEVPEVTVKKIRDFEQRKKISVLARPQLATVSGEQAQIRTVLEKIYPTEYDRPEVIIMDEGKDNGQRGITVAAPSSFRTREIGTLLNVTPTVLDKGKIISLNIIPEQSEFHGMKPTSVKIPTSPRFRAMHAKGDEAKGVKSEPPSVAGKVEVEQPDFSSANLTTHVIVASGRSIILAASNPPPEQKSIPQDHIIVIMLTATASAPGDAR
jgi:Flp pilus assembly secretin CpaC